MQRISTAGIEAASKGRAAGIEAERLRQQVLAKERDAAEKEEFLREICGQLLFNHEKNVEKRDNFYDKLSVVLATADTKDKLKQKEKDTDTSDSTSKDQMLVDAVTVARSEKKNFGKLATELGTSLDDQQVAMVQAQSLQDAAAVSMVDWNKPSSSKDAQPIRPLSPEGTVSTMLQSPESSPGRGEGDAENENEDG